MRQHTLFTALLLLGLTARLVSPSYAEGSKNPANETASEEHSNEAVHPGSPLNLTLPAHLLGVLRKEMNLIQTGMGELLAYLSQGNGSAATEVALAIQRSFVLKQQLSSEDLNLLVSSLPQSFVTQDRLFHANAGRLAAAAKAGDYLSAVRIYGSMSESCVTCHTAYAGTRFPALVDR